MIWTWALVACTGEEPGNTDNQDPPPEETGQPPIDTDTTASACVSGTFGFDGGVLYADGAELGIPADALAEDDVEIELCATASTDPAVVSTVWEVLPRDLALDGPLTMLVDHAGDDEDTALFTPAPSGDTWRNLQAQTPFPSILEAPLYRPGSVWAASDPTVVEPFVAELGGDGGGTLDLLFVVDNSCSMFNEQNQLIANFPTVIAYFDGSGLDYHIGVVSTDIDNASHSGRLREANGSKWIDDTTPGPEAVFASMASLGTAGSGTERGLGAAYLALEVLASTFNAGFLRPDASLGIIVLSDENDQTQASLITQAEFVDWLDNLKPTPDHTALYGIVSPPGGGTVYNGSIYIDVATATGGDVTSIEDANWSTFLTDSFADISGEVATAMPVAAVDGSVEGWWIPADAEQEQLDPADVVHDGVLDTVEVDFGDLPADEIWVRYLPE